MGSASAEKLSSCSACEGEAEGSSGASGGPGDPQIPSPGVRAGNGGGGVKLQQKPNPQYLKRLEQTGSHVLTTGAPGFGAIVLRPWKLPACP